MFSVPWDANPRSGTKVDLAVERLRRQTTKRPNAVRALHTVTDVHSDGGRPGRPGRSWRALCTRVTLAVYAAMWLPGGCTPSASTRTTVATEQVLFLPLSSDATHREGLTASCGPGSEDACPAAVASAADLPLPLPAPDETAVRSDEGTAPQQAQPLLANGQAVGSRVEDGEFHGIFEYPSHPEPQTRWIRFEVQPDETIEEIAARFAVEPEQIKKWNRIGRKSRALRYGRKLRIRANKFPRHRSRLSYHVRRGDTWESVARAFNLPTEALHRFNRTKGGRPLRRGQHLRLWAESALPRWGEPPSVAQPMPIEVRVPTGSASRGLPSRGRLLDGKRLPTSDLYTLKRRGAAYASTNTMAQLQRGVAGFRRRTGFEGEVLIASASRRKGGNFPPHRSHQSGRDVDIGLVAFPTYADGLEPHPREVDWGATWLLMREFARAGDVEFIFLSYFNQKKLYEAARSMGASRKELRRMIQYPRGRDTRLAVIRHAPGHEQHFHIRFQCGPADKRCKTRR